LASGFGWGSGEGGEGGENMSIYVFSFIVPWKIRTYFFLFLDEKKKNITLPFHTVQYLST
jgi:hypothetical protein